MRLATGVVDQYIYFVAVDATDYVTREPGLATWTVVRSRNGAADVTYTTPTIVEINNTTMPGVYALLVDEDMTIDAGDFSQEVCLHITHAGMAPVTRTFELYRDPGAEGDTSDVLSRLVVTNSLVTKVYSDTTTIQSDVTTLASDLAEGDFSDILSRLTVTNSNVLIIKSDVSDILSRAVVINSETTDIQSETEVIQSQVVAIRAIVSDIQSDTNVMVPIISDIQSDTNVLITKMRGVVLATGTIGATGNTTTVIHIPDGVLDSLSDNEINGYGVVIYDVSLDEYHVRTILDWTNTGDLATVSTLPFTPEASVDLYWILPPYAQQFEYDNSDIVSLLTLVRSDTAVIETVTSDIQSDTNKLVSDATEVDTSDIMSMLTLIRSDTTTLASDLAEGDFSDILSRLTVTNSDAARIESKVVQIYSDTTKIDTQTLDIQSETEVIQSLAVAIEAFVSDTYSDTTAIHTQTTKIDSDLASQFAIIEPYVSNIYSDTTRIETNVVNIAGYTYPLSPETAAIGDTGNDTTHIHMAGLTYGDDEINGYTLVVWDASEDEAHVRTISDWVNATKLATLNVALPFTPQNSTDLYYLVTGANAQVNILEGDISDVRSMLTLIRSDTTAIEGAVGGGEGDISDVLSRLTVTNSQILVIKSDTSDIRSHLVLIHSETTDIQSETEVIQSLAVVIEAYVSDIYSDTTAIHTQTTAIASDTTTLASDLAEADFSDIHSRLTLVLSDTSDIRSHLTAMTGAAGVISDIASGVDAIQAAGAALTAAQDSKLTQIHSDTQPVGTLFEIVSDIYSDTTAIEAGGGALTATQASQLARVQSIAIVIEPYTSDTVSMVTVIKSDTSDIISALVKVYSDTTKIDTQTLDIQSETEVIQSLAVAIEAFVSGTYSDTTAIHTQTTKIDSDQASQFAIIEPYVSDIYSDTTAIEGAGGALTAAQDSKLTKVNSGTIVIKSDVAQLTFTVPGKVDANIEYVNGTEVTGAGSEADPWGP
jgi:hypothetical protein